MMEEFDFSWVEEAAKKAEEYKKRNYYTNVFHHPLDRYDYDQETIWVEDWEGRQGYMTPGDLARWCYMSAGSIIFAIDRLKTTGRYSASFRDNLKRKFKKIQF